MKVDRELAEFLQIAAQMSVLELKLLRYANDLPIYGIYLHFDH